jgi:hypothetical protein
MAKKKGKKDDAEKKAALAARKEAKADKTVRKRLQKEAGGAASSDAPDGGGSDPLDSLLQQYQAADKASKTVSVETLGAFPLPRANATLTLYEDTKKRNAEVYLFGGEYFDGVENIFLDHLLKFDIGKNEWKQIHSPLRPPPRCAHSSVYYNHSMYVFGGELSRADQFYHYRDLWRYDIKEQTWEEIKPAKAVGAHPTARSGHVAVVWKHYMILFGGFYEASKDTPRWYNDVFVLDLQTQQWLDVPHSKLTARPEPRSACNASIVGDDVVIHGGFSKLSKTSQRQMSDETEIQAESKVHTDSWILHLKPILSEKPPTWERLTSSVQRSALHAGRNPNGRAAMASSAYKSRMLAFGGVVDTEALHHKMNSVFYNDLSALDTVKRKWFPVVIKQGHAGGQRRRRKEATKEAATVVTNDESDEDSDLSVVEEILDESAAQESAWNLEKLRSNMFAFIDGDGEIVYEKMGEDSDDDDDDRVRPQPPKGIEEEKEVDDSDADEEKEEEKEEDKDDSDEMNGSTTNCPGNPDGLFSSAAHQGMKNSSVMKLNSKTKNPEAVIRSDPLPRINACMIISGHTLLLYGGLLEVGDREITLDDMWSLDLRKRTAWECLWPGTMHKQVWRGGVHDDDDSYYSTDNKGDKADEDEEEDDEDEEARAGEMADESQEDGASKKDRIKAKLAELRDEHGLTEAGRTPDPGEALADFYSRTSGYWNKQTGLSEDTGASAKEIKRQGFALAKERFDGLSEVFERFAALELEYRKQKKAQKEKKKDGKKGRE